MRQHTAFAARNRAEVDAFHATAVKAGGTDDGQERFAERQNIRFGLSGRIIP